MHNFFDSLDDIRVEYPHELFVVGKGECFYQLSDETHEEGTTSDICLKLLIYLY